MQQEYSQELKEQVWQDLCSGSSYAEIMQKYSISPSLIAQWHQERDSEAFSKRKHIPDELVLEMFAQDPDLNPFKLARLLKCNIQKADSAFRRCGLVSKHALSRSGNTEEFKLKLLNEARSPKSSFRQVAEKYGVNIVTLRCWNTRFFPILKRIKQSVLQEDLQNFPDDSLEARAERLGYKVEEVDESLKRLKLSQERALEKKQNSQNARKRQQYSEEDIIRIVSELETGCSYSQLARKTGVCSNTIKRWRLKYAPHVNYKYGEKYPEPSQRQLVARYRQHYAVTNSHLTKAAIIEALENNPTYASVAEALDCTVPHLRTMMRVLDVEMQVQGRYSKDFKRAIINDIRKGIDFKTVREKYDIHSSHINAWCKKYADEHKLQDNIRLTQEKLHEELNAYPSANLEERLERLQCSAEEFGDAIVLFGWPTDRVVYSAEFRTKVVNDLLSGLTYDAVHKKYGVSQATLVTWKKKYLVDPTAHTRD